MVGKPLINPHNFIFALQLVVNQNINLLNVSGATFGVLATTNLTAPPTHAGTGALPNMAQYGDYLAVALGLGTPPYLFPMYTVLTAAAGIGDATISVQSTLPFPSTGYIIIGTEEIQYTGITPTSFTGLVRGARGTVAAAHANASGVTFGTSSGAVATLPWAPIINAFDPTTVYSSWPGTQNSADKNDSAAVNIGSVIYVKDGAGIAWLFRAENSGVTGFGKLYVGPQFFPLGLIGTDGAITSGTAILNSVAGGFTAAMVGMPITVQGAGAAAADLITTIQAFASSNQVTLAVNAGTTVASNNFVAGVGHYGDTAKDYNNVTPKGDKGYQSGTEVWMNIGQAALNPPGAAFVFQHLNYLFLWGVGYNYGIDGITGPDALWQSGFGDPRQFDPANITFAGKGDGTTAQGGAVYSLSEAGIAATAQLVLFKDSSTYSFLNAFPNAALVQVSGGLGCIAPKTIQFIGGYGVMRLSYAGVTLFDGQLEHVTEFTDAIRGYLFGGLPDVTPVDLANISQSVSTQSVNPPLYMFFAPLQGGTGYATRGFGYDFGMKQWFIVDLPFAISSAAFFPQAAVATVTALRSLVAGSNDGAVRRVFAADPDWDGTAIRWNQTLPDFGMPGTPIYIRRLNMRITADGGGATPKLTAVSFTGTRRSGQVFTRPLNTPSGIFGSMDVGEIVVSGAISVAGQGQVLIEGSDAQTSDKQTGRVGK